MCTDECKVADKKTSLSTFFGSDSQWQKRQFNWLIRGEQMLNLYLLLSHSPISHIAILVLKLTTTEMNLFVDYN